MGPALLILGVPYLFSTLGATTEIDPDSALAKVAVSKRLGAIVKSFNPALILISSVAESPWAVENCTLAAENLMLAARAGGLGTCWIGFAQAWLGTPAGKAALNLPAAHVPVAPIIVGHPKSAPPLVPRKEPDIRWIGS